MDISKEFIKMCDCPEIQDGWRPLWDDVCFSNSLGRAKLGFAKRYILNDEIENRHIDFLRRSIAHDCLIWLPRQGQLQDMIFKDIKPYIKLKLFNKWIIDNIKNYIQLTSIEQFWLVFIMWKLHQKKWDEKKWKGKNN